MSYDTDNVFAKILRGEIPSARVYEDESTLAFMDIMPRAPGHCLVIPKAPARNLFDCRRPARRFSPCTSTSSRARKASG